MISNCYAAAFSAIFLFASVHLPSNVTLKLVAIAKSSCERQWSCCATGGLPAKRLARCTNYEKAAWPDGRMAIQCTHLEQSTLGKRKPLGSRRKSISWGHSCSFWSRPFHSDMNDKSRDALCVPTSGLKRCCELVGLQFTPNMAVTFFIVVSLGHRMSTFIRPSQCPFLSKDSFFFECLVEHSNWPVPAMSNAWRLLPMSPPSDRRRRLTRAWTWNDSPKSWNLKHLLNRLCRWLNAWCMILLLYLASKLSLCNSDMLHAVFCFLGRRKPWSWLDVQRLHFKKPHIQRTERQIPERMNGRVAARIQDVQNVQKLAS